VAWPAGGERAGCHKHESVEPACLGHALADERRGGGMSQGRNFQIVFGVVVVVGVVFLASKLMGGKPVSIPANAVVTTADTAGFHGYEIGDAKAPVEIVEYVDFECIVCANWAQVQWPAVKSALIESGKVLWRIRDYPLEMHRHPRIASHAVACANDQGKLSEATEEMFRTQQNDWSLVADPMPGLKDVMKSVGVDVPTWTKCMESAKYAGRIQASVEEGGRLGVSGTPTFVIGGRLYDGLLSSDAMVKVVDSLIAMKKQTPTKP
jgi:protein-disulfide isomerase